MSDSAKTAKIYLGRHCKTAWNLEGRLIGTTDLSLCDVGWNEAKDTLPIVEKYKFDRIVSSPLKRAFDTSRYYADNLKIPLEVNQDLRELDAAQLALSGARKCPLFIPKHFTLEQRVGKGRAMNLDERARRAGAELVECFCRQFLPRPALAPYQDRGDPLGGPGNERLHLSHFRRP